MTLIYSAGSDWSEEKLSEVFGHIEVIAREELGLDYYKPQFEIINSERMLDLYASVGMPIMYPHWSFGKHYLQSAESYKKGFSGLALELVVNTSPGICYLMDENTMTQQVMVMSHAACGHAAFFKNNVFFQQWTDPSSIIDYLDFAKKYVNECEEKYGLAAVEQILDACHALQDYGVDRYKKPKKISLDNEIKRQQLREDARQQNLNILWTTIPEDKKKTNTLTRHFPIEPEENILYFIEKNAPKLEQWQRELVRIVRKIAQYFYPQKQCVTGNHLISTDHGLLRFDELINKDGYLETNSINMLTQGDKFTPASHTYLKRKAKTLRIKTETGKIFTGTFEHPLTVIQGSEHILKDLGDMTLDDYLVINTSYKNIFAKEEPKLDIPTFNSEIITCELCGMKSGSIASHIVQSHHITTSEYKEQFDVDKVTSDSHRLGKSKFNCKKYPKKMSPKLAELLAHIGVAKSSDDTASDSVFRFIDHDVNRIERVKTLLLELFGIDGLKIEKEPFFLRNMIHFSSFTLKNFINKNAPEVFSKELSIPKIIRMSTKNSVVSFIRAFIDLRAIRRSNIASFEIVGYSSQREVFEQLQTILTSLGIISIISESERLTENGLNALFGFESDSNHTCIAETLKLKVHNDHKEKFQTVIGTSDEYWQNYKITQLKGNINKSHDVYYDKIVAIEEVEELQDVYDVTIPENHLFWLDGVISHNTKVGNEGFATFTHQYIMRRLHEKGLIDDGSYLEFLACHSSVVYQPDFSSKHYSGFNPYALGSDILHDIKRICENPTDEDREWFPELIGKNWVDEVKNAAYNFRDESFIQQFLSPTVMRKWKMFKVHDIAKESYMEIEKIHNDSGFKEIRKSLAKQHSLGYREPEILINNVNLNGSRQLFLRHNRYNGVGLNPTTVRKVLANLETLWGYSVCIDSFESRQMADGTWEEKCVATYDTITTSYNP